MPTDSGGTYTLPAGYLAVTGDTITATEHNSPLEDIASALTARLPVDGSKGMSGALKAADGSAVVPSVTFSSDTDTGLYRIGANNIGIGVAGAKVLDIATTGLAVTGTLTVPGGIVGTATNNDAASGNVGECISFTIPSGSAQGLTNATAQNLTSISLTAGDWDVSANTIFSLTNAQFTSALTSISTTSATSDLTPGHVARVLIPSTLINATPGQAHWVGPVRFSLAATTTVYLVVNAGFSSGSVLAYGVLSARRVR